MTNEAKKKKCKALRAEINDLDADYAFDWNDEQYREKRRALIDELQATRRPRLTERQALREARIPADRVCPDCKKYFDHEGYWVVLDTKGSPCCRGCYAERLRKHGLTEDEL